MQKHEMHTSPDTSTGGWTYLTPGLLHVMVSPDCNKAGIDCCVRKPTDPSLDGPIFGKLLGLCEEEDATL